MFNGVSMPETVTIPKNEYRKLKEKASAFDRLSEESEWRKYALKHAMKGWVEADELIRY